MCLICNAIVSVKKVYNIKRHYDTKHAKMYVRTEAENNVRASFEVSRLIASPLKPFTDGEFVKDCLLAVVDVVYPEKKASSKSSICPRERSRAVSRISQLM